MSERQTVPEGRYGSSRHDTRSPKRRRPWVPTLASVVVGGVIAWVAYVNLGQTPVEGQRVSFAERPGNTMSVTIDVLRDDPARPVVCIVRVRDRSGAESGRREVYVPPQVQRLSTLVRSIGRPVTADIFGCSYNIPRYLSTA